MISLSVGNTCRSLAVRSSMSQKIQEEIGYIKNKLSEGNGEVICSLNHSI